MTKVSSPAANSSHRPCSALAKAYTAALMVSCVAALFPARAEAVNAGTLDPSFGLGGKTTTSLSARFDVGGYVGLQSDGKIVVAGTVDTEALGVARYNTDGTLDPTFGTDGKVIVDFTAGFADRAQALVIQPDDKILVAVVGSAFSILRLNADGSPDDTFGTGGKVRTTFPQQFGGQSAIYAMVLQADGKIVAGGTADFDFALARYNPDGMLDATFGNGGRVTTDIPRQSSFGGDGDQIYALAVQSDGRIVAGGSIDSFGATALVRYTVGGNLDTTFGGGDGMVISVLADPNDFVSDLAIQPGDKIVVAGVAGSGTTQEDFALARYDAAGTLDTTFGISGQTRTAFSERYDFAADIELQADGKIVAVGFTTKTSDTDIAIARYSADGLLDTAFGNGGKVTSSFGATENAVSVAIQPDGEIVIAGTFQISNSDSDFLVARYRQIPGSLLNISTRLRVLTGERVLIGGFIVTGTEPKKVIVRAIGPSLTSRGVTEVLENPTLDLVNSGGESIAFNDNWKDEEQAAIEASTIPPDDERESAIVRTLEPGNYTAIVRGRGDTTGIGLVEVYDLAPAANSTLANISTRGFVDTGDNAMIGGFIVGNGGSGAVVVRALGPTLPVAGALQNPTLRVVDADGTVVRENDDWKSTQQAQLEALGLQLADDREAALLVKLAPGFYTAIVRGRDGSTGVGLVEAYNLQ